MPGDNISVERLGCMTKRASLNGYKPFFSPFPSHNSVCNQFLDITERVWRSFSSVDGLPQGDWGGRREAGLGKLLSP